MVNKLGLVNLAMDSCLRARGPVLEGRDNHYPVQETGPFPGGELQGHYPVGRNREMLCLYTHISPYMGYRCGVTRTPIRVPASSGSVTKP